MATKIATAPLPPPAAHPIWRQRGGAELHEGTKVLEVGHRKDPESRAVVEKIIFDEDSVITMRDGKRLRCDVFRPAKLEGNTPLPTILIWTPYGKSGKGVLRNIDMPNGMGQPRDLLSDYQCFEAPDPIEWCPRGYALVHVDARGSGFSEGVLNWWGPQITEDVYDACDWISKQTWSNGSLGMTGSSWLGVNQWWAASTDNPHPALRAVQPWEGLLDGYMQSDVRGGIPNSFFPNLIKKGFAGAEVEDYPSIIDSEPLYTDVWKSKRVPIEKLSKVPFYVIASYSSMLHTAGSVGGFREAPIEDKWLRFHLNHEWVDIYEKESMDDSQRFFDYYLKGVENGWKQDTPRVRLSLLDFSGKFNGGLINRAEDNYPLARQQLKTFYLDASNHTLVEKPLEKEATTSYDSADGAALFYYRFENDTSIVGYMGLVLHISCDASDDLDVGVQLRKTSVDGKLLEHINFDYNGDGPAPDTNVVKYLGPDGVLRASFRNTFDPAKSTSNEFHHSFDKQEKLPPGEVAELHIPFWPAGMVFKAGEGIALKVAGSPPRLPEFPGVGSPHQNAGDHTIHTGGRFESRIVIPFV